MLRVVFRAQHLNKALDVGVFVTAVVVQGTNISNDVSHLVDSVGTTLRCGTMAGNALNVYTDFHTSAMSTVDTTIGRLGRDYELRNNFVFVVDVLPAHTIAVLFLYGTNDHDLVALRNEVQVFHDLCAVNSTCHTAFLVGTAAAVDDLVSLIALVRICVPVVDVTDTYSIDMGIDSDDLIAFAHPADYVTKTVNLYFIEV